MITQSINARNAHSLIARPFSFGSRRSYRQRLESRLLARLAQRHPQAGGLRRVWLRLVAVRLVWRLERRTLQRHKHWGDPYVLRHRLG